MKRTGWRLLLLAAGLAVLPGVAAPAAAQVQGPCNAWFNGVEAGRITSLSSPLLLADDEALVFSGTDSSGTQNAAVAVRLGPATVGSASATVAGGEFLVTLDLADVAPYGVGLLRVRATTDNCTVEAWLRLGGRLPFTTLVGLTGTVLAAAGLAAQIAALIARRRWSVPVAAAAGVATGAGAALLGQEFGRLQLSYLSLAATIAIAVVAGLGPALLLRPRRAAGHEDAEGPRVAVSPAASPPGRSPAPAPTPSAPAWEVKPAADEEAGPAAPAPAPRPVTPGPFWCYVMAEVEVLHLDDYSRVVATLHPGSWYLAKREISGWAQVVAADGTEGWVPRQSLQREG
ncbi:MAG: hypothetical protein MUE66_00135 [Acidimicrobiia bacterium]|nr:hypothetical protein [Acidimicrobiia bacterium]